MLVLNPARIRAHRVVEGHLKTIAVPPDVGLPMIMKGPGKDFLDALTGTKKGEGSRGGHIVGHTRSGKPIYRGTFGATRRREWHARTRGYTLEDHQDAQRLHWEGVRDNRDGEGLAHNMEALAHGEKIRAAGGKGIGASDVYAPGAVMAKSGTGEGSRGGKIVGHTKSGKPIYLTLHAGARDGAAAQATWKQHHQGFTATEHHEAQELHRQLAEQHRDDRVTHSHHRLHATAHAEAAEEKTVAGLRQTGRNVTRALGGRRGPSDPDPETTRALRTTGGDARREKMRADAHAYEDYRRSDIDHDLDTALDRDNARHPLPAPSETIRKSGVAAYLQSFFAKAEPKAPGSRGGKGYRTRSGTWRYGEQGGNARKDPATAWVGHTSSGKVAWSGHEPAEAYRQGKFAGWSAQDHADAARMHQRQADAPSDVAPDRNITRVASDGRHEEIDARAHHRQMAEYHRGHAARLGRERADTKERKAGASRGSPMPGHHPDCRARPVPKGASLREVNELTQRAQDAGMTMPDSDPENCSTCATGVRQAIAGLAGKTLPTASREPRVHQERWRRRES